MTYFSLYVILNEVKNPTEELTSIYFITLVVGYFACAQYDVFFLLCHCKGRSDRGNPLEKVRSTYFKGKSKFYIDGYLRKCLSENLPRVLYNKRIYFASVLKGLYIITNKTRKLAATPQSA